MFKRIWQWITRNILTRFHDFYADMTPQEHQKLLADNQAYVDEQYAKAQQEWDDAEFERKEYLSNLKAQQEMLANEYPYNFNYEEGRPNEEE